MSLFLHTLRRNRAIIITLFLCFIVTVLSSFLWLIIKKAWIEGELYFYCYFFLIDSIVFIPLLFVSLDQNNSVVFNEKILIRYGSWRKAFYERLKILPVECVILAGMRVLLYMSASLFVDINNSNLLLKGLLTFVSQSFGMIYIGIIVLLIYSLFSDMKIGAIIVFGLVLWDIIGLTGRTEHIDIVGIMQMNATAQWIAGNFSTNQVLLSWLITVVKIIVLGVLCISIVKIKHRAKA